MAFLELGNQGTDVRFKFQTKLIIRSLLKYLTQYFVAEESFCLQTDIRSGLPLSIMEKKVCCNKQDIRPETQGIECESSNDRRCVNPDQCSLNTLDERSDESLNSECPISSQICCPTNLVVKLESCDLFPGFSCIGAEECVPNPSVSKPQTAACFDRRNSGPNVCCHENDRMADRLLCESQPGYR